MVLSIKFYFRRQADSQFNTASKSTYLFMGSAGHRETSLKLQNGSNRLNTDRGPGCMSWVLQQINET